MFGEFGVRILSLCAHIQEYLASMRRSRSAIERKGDTDREENLRWKKIACSRGDFSLAASTVASVLQTVKN